MSRSVRADPCASARHAVPYIGTTLIDPRANGVAERFEIGDHEVHGGRAAFMHQVFDMDDQIEIERRVRVDLDGAVAEAILRDLPSPCVELGGDKVEQSFFAQAAWSVPELSALGLVLLALVGISVFSLWQYLQSHATTDDHDEPGRAGQTRRAVRGVVLFGVVTVVGLAVAFAVVPVGESLSFLGLILASTVTSFGGGEAYVGVADGFFVASGLVDAVVFYGQVVPIANALPGPILVKVAAGIGFLVGGWALAGAAFVVAVASCSALAVGVLGGYDRARNSLLIRNVSTYILPVICGLLASTAVSMLHSNARIGEEAGVIPVVTILISVLAAAAIPLLHRWVAGSGHHRHPRVRRDLMVRPDRSGRVISADGGSACSSSASTSAG